CARGRLSGDGDGSAPEGFEEGLGTSARSGARPGRVGRVLRRRGAEAGRRGGGTAQGRVRSRGGRTPQGRRDVPVAGRGGSRGNRSAPAPPPERRLVTVAGLAQPAPPPPARL